MLRKCGNIGILYKGENIGDEVWTLFGRRGSLKVGGGIGGQEKEAPILKANHG